MVKKSKIDFSTLWYLFFDQNKRTYTAMSYYDFSRISFSFNLKVIQKGTQEEMQRIATKQNQNQNQK